MSFRNKAFKVVLPILIVVVAVMGLKIMVASRKAPAKKPTVDRGALVETLAVRKESRQVLVPSTGTVQPRQEVSITPQVNGRVIQVADNFVAGGFFKKGDILFAVEKVDYELAREKARAEVARAELALASVESRARVAKAEWERMKNKNEAEPSGLVLYEPQLKEAQANLASARALLSQAELDLERTSLRAPFNCLIRSEQVDMGLYIRSGNPVAQVAGTDTVEIVVPVGLDELSWLTVPRKGLADKGSEATVAHLAGEQGRQWQGRIARSLGEVDPQGRMARVVVEVADPYGLQPINQSRAQLSIGMFVELLFKGSILPGIVAIPRSSLRDNNTVWVMTNDNRLAIRPVTVSRLERQEALISGGLDDGEKVVLTNLTGAADGLKLRAAGQGVE